MKLGIIGLPQAGKRTLFAALTGARGEQAAQHASRSDQSIGTVRVADERVDLLSQVYRPKKTTYAQVEYLLPSSPGGAIASKTEGAIWNQIRTCDALIHVLRNFEGPGGVAPTPEADFRRLEEEMILSDLIVAEKRIERIELDSKRGNRPNEEEYALIRTCRELLENGQPIRLNPELASAQVLRGFTFLSAKPQLVLINNDEDDESAPEWESPPERLETMVVRGRLEMDIASMPPEEAREFRAEFHIETSVLDRVIMASHRLLNLISFFTVLNDEVRAWTVEENCSALEGAGAVHSDIRKGFIRAEVLSFEHLKQYGTFPEAKKAGQVRLEGREYRIQDGDIINFRFNV